MTVDSHIQCVCEDCNACNSDHVVCLQCRLCAVFGGIYCLRRQVVAAVLDDSNRLVMQGSHASWKVLEFFSLKFQDMESPGKSLWSRKVLEVEV